MAEATLVEIQMPQMGESVTEGTILEWHVAEGDQVEEGQTVVEVSTDEVDAEVPAPASGVLTKSLAGEDLRQDAACRSRHLGIDLVGRDLDDRLPLLDLT